MTTSARRLLTETPQLAEAHSADSAWHPILAELQQSLPSQAYHTWFEPLKVYLSPEELLIVEVSSRFHYEWIEGHYADLLDQVLKTHLGNSGGMQYALSQGNGLPLEPEPAFPVANGSTGAVRSRTEALNGLNPGYTFETFIEGPPNQFARAAALAVAKSPGTTPYNPLLIYGGIGLGKTHLLQAIGNAVQKPTMDQKVRYISSERFTKEFVEAIKANNGDRFSAHYRNIDLLLMDDVQFLVGRDRTLMEFFHIFNNLYQSGKQIVLSSDKPPKELNGLDERLVSRFGWGLVCDIGPPDFDTRVAIIENLSELEGVTLSMDVIEYLATRFTKNVRDLQGALIRLMAHASLSGTEINLELARRALQDLVGSQERKVGIDRVRRVVASHYNVAPDLLLAKLRTQPIARARMVAMALSLRLCRLSLKQVGMHFGGRDHSTVLHARDSVLKWSEEDEQFAAELENILRRIESDDDH